MLDTKHVQRAVFSNRGPVVLDVSLPPSLNFDPHTPAQANIRRIL